MTKLRRSTTICCLFLGVLLLAGTSRAQTRPPIVEELAKTYGLDSYEQIEAVRYTFNLPAASHTREKIKTVSRSRLRTSGHRSTAHLPT